jgi:hypothetical protein
MVTLKDLREVVRLLKYYDRHFLHKASYYANPYDIDGPPIVNLYDDEHLLKCLLAALRNSGQRPSKKKRAKLGEKPKPRKQRQTLTLMGGEVSLKPLFDLLKRVGQYGPGGLTLFPGLTRNTLTAIGPDRMRMVYALNLILRSTIAGLLPPTAPQAVVQEVTQVPVIAVPMPEVPVVPMEDGEELRTDTAAAAASRKRTEVLTSRLDDPAPVASAAAARVKNSFLSETEQKNATAAEATGLCLRYARKFYEGVFPGGLFPAGLPHMRLVQAARAVKEMEDWVKRSKTGTTTDITTGSLRRIIRNMGYNVGGKMYLLALLRQLGCVNISPRWGTQTIIERLFAELRGGTGNALGGGHTTGISAREVSVKLAVAFAVRLNPSVAEYTVLMKREKGNISICVHKGEEECASTRYPVVLPHAGTLERSIAERTGVASGSHDEGRANFSLRSLTSKQSLIRSTLDSLTQGKGGVENDEDPTRLNSALDTYKRTASIGGLTEKPNKRAYRMAKAGLNAIAGSRILSTHAQGGLSIEDGLNKIGSLTTDIQCALAPQVALLFNADVDKAIPTTLSHFWARCLSMTAWSEWGKTKGSTLEFMQATRSASRMGLRSSLESLSRSGGGAGTGKQVLEEEDE